MSFYLTLTIFHLFVILFRATFIFILFIREIDLLYAFASTCPEKFFYQRIRSLFQYRLRFRVLTTKVHHSVLGLVNILNHEDQLANDVQRLADILFDEADHRCSEVLLDYIDIREGQTQALHVVDALHGELAAREKRSVSTSFDASRADVLLGDVFDEEEVVYDAVFVAHVL